MDAYFEALWRGLTAEQRAELAEAIHTTRMHNDMRKTGMLLISKPLGKLEVHVFDIYREYLAAQNSDLQDLIA